ncbi:MAG: zinc-dependent metalloprotease [Actinobacteria bacterium]|nr:zinc-dependent metalloprotease [Actinomycetota bacterium]
MSIPFGFQPPGEGEPLNQMGQMFEQLGKMMQGGTSAGIDWSVISEIAVTQVQTKGDQAATMSEISRTQTAGRTADLWLDQATSFPSLGADLQSWSRKDFINFTISTWQTISDPVLQRMADSMSTMMPGNDQLPPELVEMTKPMMAMLKELTSAMVGMQVGQSLAALAMDVMGAADVGLMLTKQPKPALITHRCDAYANEISVPADDLILFLGSREIARQRLFNSVDWLSGAVITAVEIHAAGMRVDTSRLQSALEGIDPTDPQAISAALEGGVLTPELTQEQQSALIRLENLLALSEGWVEVVVENAAAGKLPSYPAMFESIRRRRAAGGPAENAFAALVGLQLRPKRMRSAYEFFKKLTELVGAERRDYIWQNLDLLPKDDELENPIDLAIQVSAAL